MTKKSLLLVSTAILAMLLLTLSSSACALQDGKSDNEAIKDLISGFDEEFRNYLQEAVKLTGKEIMRFESIGLNSVHKKIEITGSHFDYGYLMGLIRNQKYKVPEKVNS
jgi:hypothetical protein